MTGNTFEQNKAFSTSAGDGGAILFYCDPSTSEYECIVSLNDNSFSNNTAKGKGGAIRYMNTNFTEEVIIERSYLEKEATKYSNPTRSIVTGNVFSENSASQGGDLGSFPY